MRYQPRLGPLLIQVSHARDAGYVTSPGMCFDPLPPFTFPFKAGHSNLFLFSHPDLLTVWPCIFLISFICFSSWKNSLVTMCNSQVIMRNERQAAMRRFPCTEPVANISVSSSTSLSPGTLNENLASRRPTCRALIAALGKLHEAPLASCVDEERGREGLPKFSHGLTGRASCTQLWPNAGTSVRPAQQSAGSCPVLQTPVQCGHSIMGPWVPLKNLRAEVTLPQWPEGHQLLWHLLYW